MEYVRGLMSLSEIIPGTLWQGGVLAYDFARLESLGIRAIISLERMLEPLRAGIRFHLSWPIIDGPVVFDDGTVNFTVGEVEEAARFGNTMLRMGFPVLVHCNSGLNRSGLIVARMLMLLEQMSADEAIARVREKRPGSLQNAEFCRFLRELPKDQSVR